MSLPTLIDPITLRAIIAHETRILDIAASILGYAEEYDEEEFEIFRNHHHAVTLANELAYIHETEHPADQPLHAAALQLKVFHLMALESWLVAMQPTDTDS